MSPVGGGAVSRLSAKRCPGERLAGAGRGGVLFAVGGAQRSNDGQSDWIRANSSTVVCDVTVTCVR